MNRRNFLRGSVGAAVAIALGRSIIEAVEAAPKPLNIKPYLTDPNAWYIKDELASGLRRFYRTSRTECLCPVLTRMPSCSRIAPGFDARACHVCGGYITDEHLEDHTSAGDELMVQDLHTHGMHLRRVSYDPATGMRSERIEPSAIRDGTFSNALPSADLTEASLEEMLVEIQKWTRDTGKPISIVPRYAHIKIPRDPSRPWISWSILDDPHRW